MAKKAAKKAKKKKKAAKKATPKNAIPSVTIKDLRPILESDTCMRISVTPLSDGSGFHVTKRGKGK
jgi:hypothetical protein